MNKNSLLKNKTTISYVGIVFVVFIWGISPLLTLNLYKYYSPCIIKVVGGFVSAISLGILFINKLKFIDKSYLKVAIPTGIFYSIAEIMQKIGLKYTTPTISAFLENLTCIVVPLLMYLFVKQKPTILKIFACVICLVGTFILNKPSGSFSLSIGVGEILCMFAGIFYGVNIAGTGAFAKKLDSGLYIFIQMVVLTIISSIVAVILNVASLPNSNVPIEKIKFSFNFLHVVLLVVYFLIVTVFCWLVRTSALKHVDATVVAIIMPFSSIVTGISSIIFGYDKLTTNLVLGAIIIFIAILLSSLSDSFAKKHFKN